MNTGSPSYQSPVERISGFALAHPTAAAAIVVSLVAVLLYGPAVGSTGWYYDDWRMLAAYGDSPSGSFGDLLSACASASPGGRLLVCVPSTVTYAVVGPSAAGFHIASIFLLALCALAIFTVLRKVGLPFAFAFLVAVVFVLYPGSDSTRLWPVGYGAQWVLGAYLGGVLLALAGIRARGLRAALLSAASAAIFVCLFLTNEAVISVVAVAGVFYVAAEGLNRRTVVRALADLTLALVFVVVRLFILPVEAGSGFVQTRTWGQTVERSIHVIGGAWNSWVIPFAGAGWVKALLVACLLLGGWAAVARPAARPPLRRWAVVCLASVMFSGAAVLAYTVANDFYVPDPESLFNRLNLMAAPAYCAFFGGLVAILWQGLSALVSSRVAGIAAAFVVLVVGGSLVLGTLDSRASYAEAWRAEQRAVAGLKRALDDRVPTRSAIVSFGHPIWEEGFIPVFASSWDLLGAINLETTHQPVAAIPAVDGSTCGPTGFSAGGAPFEDYAVPEQLWFVNVSTGSARRIGSRKACDQAYKDWGAPPFWGRTVTGMNPG